MAMNAATMKVGRCHSTSRRDVDMLVDVRKYSLSQRIKTNTHKIAN